jgi:hypothetical protein
MPYFTRIKEMDQVGFEPTTSAMSSGLTIIVAEKIRKERIPLTNNLDSTACVANPHNNCLGSIDTFSFPYICELIVTHFLYVIKEWLYIPKEVSELRTAAESLHMSIK